MFINEKLCCGVAAHGPKAAPQSVKVITIINPDNPQNGGSAMLIAGFQDRDFHHENSVPTCYNLFKWPGTARFLKFTEDFALEYYLTDGGRKMQLWRTYFYFSLTFESAIPQHFIRKKTEEINCPSDPEVNGPMKNPYYDLDRIRDEKSEIPLEDSPYQFKAAGIETSPIGFIAPSSSGPGVPIIADSSINLPVIPPSSDSSNYIEPSLPNTATIFNPNVDEFGFTRSNADCTGDDCGGAPSVQQYNEGFLDGGKPVIFRA